MWRAAVGGLVLCWALFAVIGLGSYVRVQLERRRAGAVEEPALRSGASLWGLLLEVAAFAVVWTIRRPRPELTAALWIGAAMLLAPACIVFFAAAIRELGRHFRIKAVVAADHELVTTGPYRVVRHPMYASMLGLLVANAVVVSRWEAGLAALAIYVAGTEIRVRAEDDLLRRRFPEAFASYQARARAYIPFVR